MRGRLSNQANKASAGNGGTALEPRAEAPDVTRPASVVPAAPIARLMLRQWKRVVLITLAVTAIAWSLAAIQPPRYRASALASVSPLADALQPNELLRGVEVLERRTVVATVAALAATPVTRNRAAAGPGYQVEAAVVPNTNLFRVNVEGGNAAEAAAIANRVPQVLSAQTRAMYKYYGVTMISPAATPDSPFVPRIGRAVAAGLLIGLFLGLIAAYVTPWRAARRGNAP